MRSRPREGDISRYSCTRNAMLGPRRRDELNINCRGHRVTEGIRSNNAPVTPFSRPIKRLEIDGRARGKIKFRSVEVKRFCGRFVFQGHEAERRPWSSGDARFAFNPRLSRRERNCYIRSSYVGRQSRSFTIPVFSLGHEAGALFTGRVIVGHVGVRGSTVRKLSWASSRGEEATGLEMREYDREPGIVRKGLRVPFGLKDDFTAHHAFGCKPKFISEFKL